MSHHRYPSLRGQERGFLFYITLGHVVLGVKGQLPRENSSKEPPSIY
jgi:hypothetical protein